MKNKPSRNPFSPIAKVFSRFNLVIFIVVTVSGLIISVLILNSILRLPYSTVFNSSNNKTGELDETTITLINSLKTSSENSVNQPLPSGRINPFSP